MRRGAAQETLQVNIRQGRETNMYKNLSKRAKIPFQAFKEVTFPPKAVTGFGFSYGSIPAYQHETLKNPASKHVDPIQVGPTG
jgi:hypothetical protein